MPKTVDQWLLFGYVGGEFTPLAKPQRRIGIGVIKRTL